MLRMLRSFVNNKSAPASDLGGKYSNDIVGLCDESNAASMRLCRPFDAGLISALVVADRTMIQGWFENFSLHDFA